MDEIGGIIARRYIGNCNSQPPVEGKSDASRNGVGHCPWPAAPRVVLDDIVYSRNESGRKQRPRKFRSSKVDSGTAIAKKGV